MTFERKFKLAINDSRLVILGAQVLFGFQFNGVFQELFRELPALSRGLACSGLILLMLTIGCLIAPSMQHRVVERGQDTERVLGMITVFAGLALVPLSVALAFDLFVAVGWAMGQTFGSIVGGAFFVVAASCWFGMQFLIRAKKRPAVTKGDNPKPTPIEAKVDQLLTEARVIIPGAQALLGFQLSVTLMRAFQELPESAKIVHIAALCCIALTIILLMAPASLHRISFAGEDDPAFLKIGSLLVIAAPLPLALGISLDTYVAAGRAVDSQTVAITLAAISSVALLGLWYVYPVGCRLARAPSIDD